MILLTASQRAQLLANGRQADTDHIPVVKFFNPFGAGVWLATELDEDGDIMFGLADIGYPELGFWSLNELRSIRLPFGMGIERDLLFRGGLPDLGLGRGRPRNRQHSRCRACALLLWLRLTGILSDTQIRHS